MGKQGRMLVQVLLSAAAVAPGKSPISRRSASTVIFSLPHFVTPLRSSAAWPFAPSGPLKELRQLSEQRSQLDDLATKLKSDGNERIRGDSAEGATVVLQTITIQFGDTGRLLQKTTTAMPALGDEQLARARELSERFVTELGKVRQGCREKSTSLMLAGTEAARETLSEFLGVASTKYTFPSYSPPPLYSKDPSVFAAQYYGVLSCEGQGLKRIPGSNTCIKSNTAKNLNPFPTFSISTSLRARL